jgi:hypothetical protein
MLLNFFFNFVGASAHSIASGWDMPTPSHLRRHRAALQATALSRITGAPRLRPRAITRRDLAKLTCKQLDSLLRTRQVKGRSKARTKAAKIQLLARA